MWIFMFNGNKLALSQTCSNTSQQMLPGDLGVQDPANSTVKAVQLGT